LLDFAFHLGRVVNRCSKLRWPKRRSGLYKSPFPEVLGDNPMQQQTPNYPLSMALAAGAVNTALLNILVAKGLLSLDEVRSLLDNAQRLLMTSTDPNATEGARLIESLKDYALKRIADGLA
jgi:hypothetical protein